jgi:ABC-2 type transport system permease protein
VAQLARIYRTFFTSSLVRELEFRANFFASILQNIAWIVFYILIVLVIFSQTKSVAGWTREMVFILMGSVFLMSSLHAMFFGSCFEIPEQVRRGTLDFVITKPVDAQFWVSLRRFTFHRIGSVGAALVMLAFGIVGGKFAPGFENWAAFLLSLLGALVLFYAMGMLLMTLSIYFVRVDNLWVLGETALETARFPIDVYRTGFRDLLIYYIPLAFLATVPAETLIGEVDWMKLSAGLVWAAGLFAATRWWWNHSLKSYTSASS